MSFRFEIPNRNIADLSQEASERLQAFVAGGPEVVFWEDYAKDATVVVGKLPQPKVTVMQALAMGHDVDAVLDLLERQP